jgi:hypothetical protein
MCVAFEKQIRQCTKMSLFDQLHLSFFMIINGYYHARNYLFSNSVIDVGTFGQGPYKWDELEILSMKDPTFNIKTAD